VGEVFSQLYPQSNVEELEQLTKSAFVLNHSYYAMQLQTVSLPLEQKCQLLESDIPLAQQIKSSPVSKANLFSIGLTVRDNICGVDALLKKFSLQPEIFKPSDFDASFDYGGREYALEIKRSDLSDCPDMEAFLREKFGALAAKAKGRPIRAAVFVEDLSAAEKIRLEEALAEVHKAFKQWNIKITFVEGPKDV
jgi:hypothetical protein